MLWPILFPPKAMGTCFGDGNVFYKFKLVKMRRERIYKNAFFGPLKACYGHKGRCTRWGRSKAHVLFWVRIMKRRVRTVAMPFLLSVLVLCLSKHCMLVQLLREKIAALSIYHVFWQLLLCDSLQRSSCYDTWVNSRNLYTSARTEEGIVIVLTRRIGPTFQEVW